MIRAYCMLTMSPRKRSRPNDEPELPQFDPDHALGLARALHAMFQAKHATDFTVIVGDRRFELHRAVAAVGSGYFRTLFGTSIGGDFAGKTELNDVTPQAFEAIAESLYTGRINNDALTEDTVIGLLEASRRLEAFRAESQCIEWLEMHMTAPNVAGIWDAAGLLDLPELRSKAVREAAWQWDAVSRSNGFLALGATELAELVQDDALAVEEKAVFEAVMRWVEDDAERRLDHLGLVLGAVRLGLLPVTFLARDVAEHPLVQQSTEVQVHALLNSAFVCHHNPTNADAAMRRRRLVRSMLYVVGGDSELWGVLGLIKIAECFDPSLGTWRTLPDMRTTRSSCGAASIDGKLYVVGGRDSREGLKSAEYFDPLVGMWQDLPDMTFARSECCAASIDGTLYVVGGADYTGRYIKSAERFDTSVGLWQVLPEMNVERHGFGAASIDGKLYVVGGADRSRCLKSAECFDPSVGGWQALPEMIEERLGCGAASIDGKLYVVGGFDVTGRVRKSVACFDPSVGQWQALPDMNFARFKCGVASIEGKLYVVGGADNMRRYLKSVECFDPSVGQWQMVPDFPVGLANCAAA